MTPEQKAREEWLAKYKSREGKAIARRAWDAHAAWAKAAASNCGEAGNLFLIVSCADGTYNSYLTEGMDATRRKVCEEFYSGTYEEAQEEEWMVDLLKRFDDPDEWECDHELGKTRFKEKGEQCYLEVLLVRDSGSFLAGRASLRAEMEAMDMAMATQGVDYGAAQERKDSEIAQLLEPIKRMEEGICVTCDQLAAAQKEIGLLHEAIGQAERREVALKSQLAAASITLRDRVLLKRNIAKLEATNTRECEKMREALEDAEESLTSQHEEMVHFFENKCCPTEDEVVAAYNARQAAREALRPDSAKVKP